MYVCVYVSFNMIFVCLSLYRSKYGLPLPVWSLGFDEIWQGVECGDVVCVLDATLPQAVAPPPLQYFEVLQLGGSRPLRRWIRVDLWCACIYLSSSVCLSLCPGLYLCLSVHLSQFLSLSFSVSLSLDCLSLCMSVSPCLTLSISCSLS